jgi:preprotein translocase subunit YajC
MIEIAFAQGTQAASGGAGSSYLSLIPIVLMIVIFFFLIIRPQQKKEKDRKNMISALKQGDKVLTAGGLYGVVDSFKEGEVVILKIANNTKVEVAKSAIQGKVS